MQSYIIKFSLSVCLCVSMLVRNRLPNHANYGDGISTGESVMKKILFKQASKSSLIFIMKEITVTNLTPLIHNR